MWSTASSNWDSGPARRRILGRLRRPSRLEGLGEAAMTSGLLEVLGERHQTPRGPGQRWRRSAPRTHEPRDDAEEAVDFDEAIASW
ncbi:hypothetical protein LXT21_08950 [Myxococcus sp. K38C18041901]|uniref:hypothetical protein n=1 Tax=Myxococcus guangdongensis TaxID=2906760 RepID=UPI0020A7C9E3|nr:hypothetical protein [Myxococcus guangdongensis]MCP3058898.1 hypothetical protein [Myxococcus guangdongensis]